MTNASVQRIYNISDPELIGFSQHVSDCISRDITDFELYNVTSLAVSNLQSICDAFKIFPTDDYVYQEYLSANETKDALIEAMKEIIRKMALRVEMKWSKNSPKYRSIGISDVYNCPDEAFIMRARLILEFMIENKTELISEGLTDEMLDQMEEKLQELIDAKYLQKEKFTNRAEKTIERVEKGNELYGIVSKYCEIGKQIWERVNPAKYKDYVIYGASNKKAVNPKNIDEN
ncbi:MAG: hypothetical protein NT007_10165 [Candidatus Kapabacteria bacterium]|nr:hypothetical protein [Candidatus Kapabacteria bacterium]